jgi:hypothetical protein
MVSPATGAGVFARLRDGLRALRACAVDLVTADGGALRSADAPAARTADAGALATADAGAVRADATYWFTGVVLFLLAFALLLWAMFSLV